MDGREAAFWFATPPSRSMRKPSSGLGTVTTVVMALQKTTKKPCSGTDPEVARVGLNEQDAKRQGVAVEVTRFDLDDLDRALADEEGRGFVKCSRPRQGQDPRRHHRCGYYSSPSTSQASIKVLQYPTATLESENSRVTVSSFPLFTFHLL